MPRRPGEKDPQVDILQLLDVLYDAGEEVSATVVQQTGRRQGREAGVETGPELRQQPEGNVVRDEPLGVARGGAGDAEEANEEDRDREQREHRHHGGGGDHVRRRGQEPHVARHGRHPQQDAEAPPATCRARKPSRRRNILTPARPHRRPPEASNAVAGEQSCVDPVSDDPALFRTRILSAARTVFRRWATTREVRLCARRSRAPPMSVSLSGSRVEVGSSITSSGRVLQEGARDRQPLGLAAGETRAPVPDWGVLTARQPAHELRCPRELGRPLDLGLAASLRPRQPDVLQHAAVEEVRALRHQRHVFPPGRRRQAAEMGTPSAMMTRPWAPGTSGASPPAVLLPEPLRPTRAVVCRPRG